jgi:trehalose 6-phosphate synthase
MCREAPVMTTMIILALIISGLVVMIIGVDRLDYSKGIALRMEAFDRFLSAHPHWRGKVTYLQIAPKSRSENF